MDMKKWKGRRQRGREGRGERERASERGRKGDR